jgi:hypothetical protein
MPADLGSLYLQGLHTAASIASERQRIAAERQRTEMEAQARAATEQRISLESQAQLQTQKAYHDAQLSMRQHQLEQAAQINAQRTREAALKMADESGFADDIKKGMSIEAALYRHPRVSSPANVLQAHKQALDLGSQRLELSKQRLAEKTQADQERQRRLGGSRESTTMEYPATPEVSAQSASSGFLGFGAHPAIAAVPGQPARKVTTVRELSGYPMPGDPAAPVPSNGVQAPPALPSVKEVSRKTKDGRTAIFDANTKQFLRYADADAQSADTAPSQSETP